MSGVSSEHTELTEGGPAGLPPAILVEDVGKTYPGVRALKGVSVSVEQAEFRALVGENGSGKSTLVGILGGKTVADPGGRVEVFGEPLTQGHPSASAAAGIAVIHQELMMVPQMSAMENVFLGDMPRRSGIVAFADMRDEYEELSKRLGIDIPPKTEVGSLSVAQQTTLEIMRAVRRNARLMIMDEPTVTLGVPEREKLYNIIAGLREQKVTFLLISHDLEEVLRLADSVTVFREGSHVRTAPRADWDKRKLVTAMLGERRAKDGLEDANPFAAGLLAKTILTGEGSATAGHAAPASASKRLLTIRNVIAGTKVHLSELSVGEGEIVGLGGLVGSGRTSLLRAIAGAAPASGDMEIEDAPVRWPRNVPEALSRGIALLPEDRKGQGLMLDLPAYDNVTMADLGQVAQNGFLSKGRSEDRATGLLESVEFRGTVDGNVRSLSGGNQQKVMVAKWLHRAPKILLIDEPTRGIDIGAKQDILRVIQELADRGHGIVWVSSELEEVVAVSHRVVLISRGRAVGELTGSEITVERAVAGIFEADSEQEQEGQANPVASS